MIDGPHCVYFYFQNCDMEPKYVRVTNCSWRMVGWASHWTYNVRFVSSVVVPSPHVPCLHFQRIGNDEGLDMVLALIVRTDAHEITQACLDV